MFGNTHRMRRMAAGIVVAGAFSLFVAPAAFGHFPTDAGQQTQLPFVVDGRAPDTLDAALAARQQASTPQDVRDHQLSGSLYSTQLLVPADGRSPDTKDAAQQAQLSTVVDGRSADTLDAAYQAQLPVVVDGRSPDTKDAATLARTQVIEVGGSNGFSWGDFGIGAAVSVGMLFILIGLAIGLREARQARHRLGHA